MKNKKLIIVSIILLSLCTISLLAIMIWGILNPSLINVKFISLGQSDNLTLSKTYDNIFNEIKLDITNTDIEFKNSSDDKIKIDVYSEKEKPKINQKENTLNIEFDAQKCFGICLQKSPHLIIYIPETFSKKLNVKNNNGDIKIAKTNGNINVKSTTGDITVNKANRINIETKYGDVLTENANVLTVKKTYGEVKAGTINGQTSIKTTYGDIKINNIFLTNNSKLETKYGEITVEKLSNGKALGDTKWGEIKINNSSNLGNYTLTSVTKYGDINIG